MNVFDILLSPCCNEKFLKKTDSVVCSFCGKSYPVDGNYVKLVKEAEANDKAIKKIRPFSRLTYSIFNPLIKFYEKKLNSYYERSLNDKDKAERFRGAYLSFSESYDRLSVLDFGCGRGRICALLASLGYVTVGLDIKDHDLWRRMPSVQFVQFPHIDRNLPFRDGSFDLCIHYFVLGYLKDQLKNLKEIKRVLKMGGYLNLQVANKTNLYTITTGRFIERNYKLFSLNELKELLGGAGFEIRDINTEKFYAPFFPQAINFIRYILSKDYDPFFDRNSIFVKLTPPKFRGIVNIIAKA